MPRLRWIILGCVSAFILSIAMTAYINEVTKIVRLKDRLDNRIDQLVRKSRTIEDYRSKIEFYSSPRGVEKLAREEFNMKYPDERVYRIVITSGDNLSESSQ